MHRSPQHQRGATTLLVIVVLLFAMTLMASFANRNLVFEQRSAANLVRSTQAFEAAEAGIEWAVAMLNQRQRIDADCRPSQQPHDRSFRERRLRLNSADGTHSALTWDYAGKPVALLAACVRGAGGWACSCPASGLPSPSAPAGSDVHPAFTVQLAAGPQPGLVRLSATGCAGRDASCSDDAAAHVEVLLGLVPGLSTPPAAALTAREGVAMNGALGVHHADARAGGLTVHAGADVVLPAARTTPAWPKRQTTPSSRPISASTRPPGATSRSSRAWPATATAVAPSQPPLGLAPRRWSGSTATSRSTGRSLWAAPSARSSSSRRATSVCAAR